MFTSSRIVRPPFDCAMLLARGGRERQSMTDPTSNIAAALREAQLQRLEASLASRPEVKQQSKLNIVANKDSIARDSNDSFDLLA